MTSNASRVPVDYDGFEHDRQPAPAQTGARPDPLAELARIVGQDDPFRALLEAKEAKEATRAAESRGRVEPVMPNYGEAGFSAPDGALAPAAPSPRWGAVASSGRRLQPVSRGVRARGRRRSGPDGRRGGARSRRRAAAPRPPAHRPGGHRARHRRRVDRRRPDLEGVPPRPFRRADPGHGRPGAAQGRAAECRRRRDPDQNKQIYERGPIAKDGQIRIVNREEQPLDVKQAARALVAEAGPAASPATPGNALTESSASRAGCAPSRCGPSRRRPRRSAPRRKPSRRPRRRKAPPRRRSRP